MSDFFGSIWWLIVSIGLLVTFHEFGHFWVARRCGVKVLRFSVGFGNALWSRYGRDGTEYRIAAIPLGGYVKMLDEREGDVPPSEAQRAFNNKSVWQRIAIVAAGPIANLVMCVALLWAMYVIGKQDYSPTVGRTSAIAEQAGLRAGDRVESVYKRATATWADATQAIMLAAIDRHDVPLRVSDAQGNERTLVLPLSRLPSDFDETQFSRQTGLRWRFTLQPAVVGKITPGTPAYGVLAEGDRITAVDGEPVLDAEDLVSQVSRLGERGGSAMIEVERDGARMAWTIAPRRLNDPEGKPYWGLGIQLAAAEQPAYDAVQRFGPLAAVPQAFNATAAMAWDSLGMIRRMLTGQASIKNISGPITIARVANDTAKRGLDWFLNFLALLSLSLAIINLLPIPVLDGGHLLYYLIELVKGSPLSERAMAAGQYVGLALLASLMGLAFYNDILGLVR